MSEEKTPSTESEQKSATQDNPVVNRLFELINRGDIRGFERLLTRSAILSQNPRSLFEKVDAEGANIQDMHPADRGMHADVVRELLQQCPPTISVTSGKSCG